MFKVKLINKHYIFIYFPNIFFFHNMFRVCSINYERQSRHGSVRMQSSISNRDLHMPPELQMQMVTLWHAAARQPEKQDNCGDSQFVSFLCYPLNT